MSRKKKEAYVPTDAEESFNPADPMGSQDRNNGYLAAINDITAALLKRDMTDAARIALGFSKGRS